MRRIIVPTLGLLVFVAACSSQRKSYEGPTVDSFVGQLTVNGKPVSFPSGEDVVLRAYQHGNARMWGIPIQADGTFKIGWMPIGKYTSILARAPKSSKGARNNLYSVPGSFEIVEGKTEYSIELGKGFKP